MNIVLKEVTAYLRVSIVKNSIKSYFLVIEVAANTWVLYTKK